MERGCVVGGRLHAESGGEVVQVVPWVDSGVEFMREGGEGAGEGDGGKVRVIGVC